MKNGFARVAACVPVTRPCQCDANAARIVVEAQRAADALADVAVFPELCITGCTAADFYLHTGLQTQAEAALADLAKATSGLPTLLALGLPVVLEGRLFNCAVLLQRGRILGVVPKTYLPGYAEFYEPRWFEPAYRAPSDTVRLAGQTAPFGTDLLFEDAVKGLVVGVEICEDLWVPIPPSSYQALAGAHLVLNLSASNELVGKASYRRSLVLSRSASCILGYAYASAGPGESTTDVVFSGHAMVAENGVLLTESPLFRPEGGTMLADLDVARILRERMRNRSFFDGGSPHGSPLVPNYRRVAFEANGGPARPEDLMRFVDPSPFVPASEPEAFARSREIVAIQAAGLAQRLSAAKARKAIVAVSGGLDSALALLVAAKACDRLGLPRTATIGITMPGPGTTGRTRGNSELLVRALGADFRTIPIGDAIDVHLRDIGQPVGLHDTTYENAQARERCQIAMDVANREGGLMVGTGDLSELAIGFTTYGGDHMSMYAVNTGVPKTLVRSLVRTLAEDMPECRDVLLDILATPVSPELLPPDEDGGILQRTEEIVGPYELHDFFLYHFVRFGETPQRVLFLAEKAFAGRYAKKELKRVLAVFLQRFFQSQFKRSCIPDGPKVGSVALSPRGDLRMPSDASPEAFLKDLEDAP
jgi:NAD+ synthase (glutamine-hydrolysing)